MSADALSDVMRTVRLTGATFFDRRRYGAFWLLVVAAFSFAIAGAFQVGLA